MAFERFDNLQYVDVKMTPRRLEIQNIKFQMNVSVWWYNFVSEFKHSWLRGMSKNYLVILL
jgi:hypothetical protein